MPYLQEKTSLSNVLFWASLSYGFKLLQASLLGDTTATRVAWEVFGTIPPLQPGRDVLQGLHARLRFRGAGTLDADHPGNNPDVALRFHEMMVAACEANGTPIDTFLPPPAIETLLRARLGTRYHLLEQGLHDGGDPGVRTVVCAFVGDMVKGSICLGDGPRWTADRATAMLDAFHRRLALA
ncbi:predicted protein [Verticillium alfalfae VaMs.102]|uniref:Predicted protein n=1 Tax=Verticillium alfalfae (strain VaMs.102 / ATCC MYA-4576 / FGSC 10136) TaxID=526221 RepID=C9SCJ9_VERA1|nr:predicted protein [Verticillium alfalfae VaMs.102]EEY16814.1 predicted protein [Verticillium alfalfae VaMs.102]